MPHLFLCTLKTSISSKEILLCTAGHVQYILEPSWGRDGFFLIMPSSPIQLFEWAYIAARSIRWYSSLLSAPHYKVDGANQACSPVGAWSQQRHEDAAAGGERWSSWLWELHHSTAVLWAGSFCFCAPSCWTSCGHEPAASHAPKEELHQKIRIPFGKLSDLMCRQ